MTVSGTLYGEAFYGGLSGVTVTGGALTAGAIVGIQTIFNLTSSTMTVNGNVSDGSSGYYNDPFSEYNVSGGSFTVKGAFISCGDRVNATNGAKVRFSTLQQDARDFGVYLTTDAMSSIEIGKAGGAAAGTITIDKGVTVTQSGEFSAPTIADNGTLAVAPGQSLELNGALAGSGSLSIGANAALAFSGGGAGNTVSFAGTDGTLQVSDASGLPNGVTLQGFVSGENLEVQGITDAAYVGGNMVLYDNGAGVGSFNVGASYAGDSFDVVSLGNGYSQITFGPTWLNPVSGDFSNAADWSTGAVPGANDSVALSVAGTYTVAVTTSTTMRSVEETDSGATLSIGAGDALTLSAGSNFNGDITGLGSLNLTGGLTTFEGDGAISTGSWLLSGTGTDVTLNQALTYTGTFQDQDAAVTLSGGNLTLNGSVTLTDDSINGMDTLIDLGTTNISGFTIGGTAQFENAGVLSQSGNSVTVGDTLGDAASLLNATTGTYDILDNSGIALGAAATSLVTNDGIFEKTGGGGFSNIAPNFVNSSQVLVSSGTLDFEGAVTGSGTDTIGAGSTLEFDSTMSSGQTIAFSGTGGTLDLGNPLGYQGAYIADFAATDNVDLAGAWSLLSFKENAAGTLGTLTLTNGTNQVALDFAGSFTQSSFTINSGATTIIGHS